MPTQSQITIKQEALSGKGFNELSKEAQYYRNYGTFQAPIAPATPQVPSGVSYNPKTNISTVVAPKTPTPTPTASGLTRVPTGSVGPDGKPIYDVFEGGRKLELPEFQQRGLNVEQIAIGKAPEGFKSEFLPFDTDLNKGVLSDT